MTETVKATNEVKPKPVYKKTDRIRTVDKHKQLDVVADGLRTNLELVLGRDVKVEVTRSEERRYARALFKVDIDGIVLDAKTMEEILEFAQGVRIVTEMKRA
jgi:hypothetical protein